MADPRKYTVGWICAITTEFVAAQAFLDEEHEKLEAAVDNDNNNYALGRIGKHNIVMAVLPKSEYGTTTAATVARDMLRTFPNVRVGLMVGIGGGAPSADHDIRLGDVVVSARDGGKGGVFQYDHGKAIQDRAFVETGSLNQPPQLLLTALSSLEAEYERKGHRLNTDIDRALEQWPRLRKRYSRPPPDSDKLYQPRHVHPDSSDECSEMCSDDPAPLMHRTKRHEQQDDPAIHYGLIASANRLMKDALARDKLAADHNILCFEMEAAGLMNHFPCLVIRGICDYCDSHKNDDWQGFAAMVAAAYAKDLLRQIPPSKVEAERPISKLLCYIEENLNSMHLMVHETKDAMANMTSDSHHAKVERWLSPPDYSTNASLARKHRHPGTGNWLLTSSAFLEWKLGSRRHLWLYGPAGCGKTVLSTTILDHLLQTDTDTRLAFFFDFNDPRKQTLESLQRSLAFQLYHSGDEAAELLDSLFTSHDDGRRQPDISALSACVDRMMEITGKVIVILDALDECTTREELLSWIQGFASGNTRLIVTGRPEADFQRKIPLFFNRHNCITLDKTAIDKDIRSYVMATLERNPDFVDKTLSRDLLEEICEKVGGGADGMFRWAACQLDSLAKCLSPKSIKTALKSLPHDLNETYCRMIRNIPPEYKGAAIRLLQFLVYARRPLTLSEAIEVIATQIDEDPRGFDIEGRLCRKADVLLYCPSLVSIAHVTERNNVVEELHLAHFSVKEYLLKQDQFDLESASIVITRTCLAYLTDIHGRHHKIKRDFPMARYAATVWMDYAVSVESSEDTVRMAANFLKSETTFQRWGRLYQADHEQENGSGPPEGSRLYYTCLGGLLKTTKALIEGTDVNTQGGRYGNALQAASQQGSQEIVRLLLDKGADINAQGGLYGNALQAAASGGHLEVVELLLDNGADINAQGGEYGNALQAASQRGNRGIVGLLLDEGADINARGGEYTSALQAASSGGHLEVVELLLEKGADINAQVNFYGSALQAAASGSHLKVVELLLDKGADINAQGGEYGNALQAASQQGNRGIVGLLLDEGADINAQGGRCGNALQAASSGGHLEVVELLLEKGADINAQGNFYGSALQAAVSGSHLKVVELLLDNGADINDHSGEYSNDLQNASLLGHLEVVKLLLDKGADINAQGGYYGNAIQAASLRGHFEVVELLLDKGADINAQGGEYGNALQAAASGGHLEVAELLLDKGADINAHGGEYGNALQAASLGGHFDVAELLLDKGADINAQGGYYDNALQAASLRGSCEIVGLLLDKGADINTHGGEYGNALQAASLRGSCEIVGLLLDKGADINAQSGRYDNALQAASLGGRLEVAELLLDKGADINAQGGEYGNALQAASSGGHLEVAELLLDKGADINAHGGEYGNALQAASLGGHFDVAELLLDKGADINAHGGEYGNALQAASQQGNRGIVGLLLDKGADINVQGGRYGNALQAATLGGHFEIIQLLNQKSASKTSRKRSGSPNSMHMAKRPKPLDPSNLD